MTISITDFLLRTRPYLLFLPWLAVLFTWAIVQGHVDRWPQALLWIGGGMLAWTLIEWVFHRAMHLPVRSPALARFQDQAHIRHHREPHDVEHSVVNLSGSFPLALLFFGICFLIFRDLQTALLFHSGLLIGYLAYEFVHLATHAKWRFPGLNYLTRYHSRHHFEGWNRTYGVTSPLWDWIFQTSPNNSPKETSEHLSLRGETRADGKQ